MQLIKENKECNWYLVKDWTTKSGLRAQVLKRVWNDEVKNIASSLHDNCCGYVQYMKDDDFNYNDLDVHGGITFGPSQDHWNKDDTTTWIGFDMAHWGDENIADHESYAEKECERLAEQLSND